MSHEMTKDDIMFSVREAPWHMGMGTNVTILETAPEKRQERIAAAGHDWLVDEHEILHRVEVYDRQFDMFMDDLVPLEGYRALIRSDTKTVLAVAKSSYTVVQNVVGHEIFEALIEGGNLIDATGGTTHGGAVCYLCGKLDEPRFVNGDNSPTYPYTGVLWSHNFTTGLVALEGIIRIVCKNTADLAMMLAKRSGRLYSWKHTTNVLDHIEEAKAVIRGVSVNAAQYIDICNELGLFKVSTSQRNEFIKAVIPEPPNAFISDRVKRNIDEARTDLAGLFLTDTIPDAHKDTGLGLLYAGVEYLDHIRSYQSMDTYIGRTLLKTEPLKRRLVPIIREVVR